MKYTKLTKLVLAGIATASISFKGISRVDASITKSDLLSKATNLTLKSGNEKISSHLKNENSFIDSFICWGGSPTVAYSKMSAKPLKFTEVLSSESWEDSSYNYISLNNKWYKVKNNASDLSKAISTPKVNASIFKLKKEKKGYKLTYTMSKKSLSKDKGGRLNDQNLYNSLGVKVKRSNLIVMENHVVTYSFSKKQKLISISLKTASKYKKHYLNTSIKFSDFNKYSDLVVPKNIIDNAAELKK